MTRIAVCPTAIWILLICWSTGLAVRSDARLVHLTDHRLPAYLEFSSSAYSVAADQTNAVIVVIRTGEFREAVSVQYATEDSTAAAGQDYLATTGTLVIPAGAGVGSFIVPIRSRPGDGVLRSLVLHLTNPSVNGLITSNRAILTIIPLANEASTIPPGLSVRGTGSAIILSWLASDIPCALERTDDLAGQRWVRVASDVQIVNGRCQVAEPPDGAHFFYRLRVQP